MSLNDQDEDPIERSTKEIEYTPNFKHIFTSNQTSAVNVTPQADSDFRVGALRQQQPSPLILRPASRSAILLSRRLQPQQQSQVAAPQEQPQAQVAGSSSPVRAHTAPQTSGPQTAPSQVSPSPNMNQHFDYTRQQSGLAPVPQNNQVQYVPQQVHNRYSPYQQPINMESRASTIPMDRNYGAQQQQIRILTNQQTQEIQQIPCNNQNCTQTYERPSTGATNAPPPACHSNERIVMSYSMRDFYDSQLNQQVPHQQQQAQFQGFQPPPHTLPQLPIQYRTVRAHLQPGPQIQPSPTQIVASSHNNIVNAHQVQMTSDTNRRNSVISQQFTQSLAHLLYSTPCSPDSLAPLNAANNHQQALSQASNAAPQYHIIRDTVPRTARGRPRNTTGSRRGPPTSTSLPTTQVTQIPTAVPEPIRQMPQTGTVQTTATSIIQPQVSVSSTTTLASCPPRQQSAETQTELELFNKACQVDPRPTLMVNRSLSAVVVTHDAETQTEVDHPEPPEKIQKTFEDRAISPIIFPPSPLKGVKRKVTAKRNIKRDDASEDEINIMS